MPRLTDVEMRLQRLYMTALLALVENLQDLGCALRGFGANLPVLPEGEN
jgi:hypothetical protein